MEEFATRLLTQTGLPPGALAAVGAAAAVLLLYFGAAASLARKSPAAARLSSLGEARRRQSGDLALLKAPGAQPGGLMKAFVPASRSERSELENKLSQAGFSQEGALRRFTLIRVFLGLAVPGLLLLVIAAAKTPGLLPPNPFTAQVAGWTNLQVFQALSGLVGTGYFGPVYVLNARAAARRRRIEEAFPNALDLMRISVDSGLGFDAAMTRVGNELGQVSPDLAFELLSVQRQIQAGRARGDALLDMAGRTGVDTVRSFANVALQSMQFGTSMASALATYSEDLRSQREMRAQEMASKLPVKMSAVLASLMLPALVMITIGPVVIRYIRFIAS
ncbi:MULTISPECIES: type II secretion system F family protein [unclassified Leisingera]|uniref:type II secretion system F family protein n=1 Tax=unclassified Leisingera TaxID=2614906 RepID=UPI000301CE2F|nr:MULTISPECIES: type II secretion system F family protein [unclassified Leisingera]KIC24867.1 type II secretion system protein [Leisingera sp. ANG-S3]KIC31425.1 type II secretion system protein [Leisingera sp. ANG-S5]KIC55277.1 type II secretion system protein [Leisingera sp. ANG-S]KID09009.1 type II secretion system protein [Leisingera sp. ANG1]